MDFWKKNEARILLVLLFNAFLFIFLFFYDLNRRLDTRNRLIIGSVQFKKNIIQRRFDNQLVWESLYQNSLITNRDTIRSESLSDATIRLKDGTEISIDENSMFFLDMSEEDARIEFSKGSLQIRKSDSPNDRLRIQSANKEIIISEADIQIQKDSSSQFQVLVEKGRAIIRSRGESTPVSSGSQADLSSDSIAVKQIPIQLLNPLNYEILGTNGEKLNVNFKWKLAEGISNSEFEISKNPKFNPVFKKEILTTGTSSVSLTLDPGSYYWRVRTNRENSFVYRFHIVTESGIRLSLPQNKETFTYVESAPTVSFQWQTDSTTKESVLQISQSKDFSDIVHEEPTGATQINLKNLKEGRYYWRVKTNPIQPGLAEKSSPIGSFTISKLKTLPPPVPAKPTGDPGPNEKFMDRPVFVWTGTEEMVRYRIEIAEDPKFQKLIERGDTTTNFFQPNSRLNESNLYWRVKGFTAKNTESPFSEPHSFRWEKPQSKSETKKYPESQQALQKEPGYPDIKSGPKLDSKSEKKPDPKLEEKSVAKSDGKLDPKPEGKPDQNLDTKSQSPSHSSRNTQTDPKTDSASGSDSNDSSKQGSSKPDLVATARDPKEDKASPEKPQTESAKDLPECAGTEIPRNLIRECRGDHILLDLSNAEKRDLYQYFLLNSSNEVSRRSALVYFSQNCPQNLPGLLESLQRMNQDPKLRSRVGEKRFVQEALENLQSCKGR
jgi:hypothetical protein